MPPYIYRKCPHCSQRNTFDMLELTRQEKLIFRQVSEEEPREFSVTCRFCGQGFVALVKKSASGGKGSHGR